MKGSDMTRKYEAYRHGDDMVLFVYEEDDATIDRIVLCGDAISFVFPKNMNDTVLHWLKQGGGDV